MEERMKLRNDCDQIVRRAIAAVQPDAAVRRALEGNPFQGGRVVLVACLLYTSDAADD